MIQELGRSSANDNIDIYFRRPVDIQKDKSDHRISTSADNTQNIYVTSPDSGPHSITSTFRRSPSRRDKIEIDSDNIETPPVTRKAMAIPSAAAGDKSASHDALDSAKRVLDSGHDGEPLGNGQFDRFSSARKTRRYKRPTLSNAGSDDQSTAVTPEPTNEKAQGTTKVYLESPKSPPAMGIEQMSHHLTPSSEDKESRLKRWQERLKSLDQLNNEDDGLLDNPTPTNTTSRSSSRKNMVSAAVNPEEVKDAVHYLQRQTSHRSSANKVINMELNDEGFEESQSLVSDTPSQGKDNNSGTETSEQVATGSATTTTTAGMKAVVKATPKGRSLTPLGNRSTMATRTQSLRSASATRASAGTPCSRPNLPLRQNSLRKNESDSGLATKKIAVQKSNSRNSLLSSRSSLNSGTSTNTVKKAPTTKASPLDTSTSASSINNRKLGLVNHPRTTTTSTTKIPGAMTSGTSKAASPASNSLSSMRSNTLTSASAAAQRLREQLTPRPDSVNNRLNVAQAPTSNYPLKGSLSGGVPSTAAITNSINSYTNKIPNPTNSTINNNVNSSRPSMSNHTGLTRKGSAGSNFMRPTASASAKATPLMGATASSAAPKPSRFR